jgi:hypothetical protein
MKDTANQNSESTHAVISPKKDTNIPFSVELVLKQQQQLKEYQQQLQEQQKLIHAQHQQLKDSIAELAQLKRHPLPLKKESRKTPSWDFQTAFQKVTSYFDGLYGSEKYQPRFPLRQILFSYIGSFLGIAALAYISVNTNYPLIAAPFGAAAVLLFAAPDSPLAQPRNCVFGNCLGAIVSLVMVHAFGSEPWVMALAVATSIKVMQLTKTLHPPGGAVALVGVMSKAEWSFLFTPVLAGSIILVICTTIFNNLMPGRSYPKHWL